MVCLICLNKIEIDLPHDIDVGLCELWLVTNSVMGKNVNIMDE